MHSNLNGLSCYLVWAQLGSRKNLGTLPRSASWAHVSALRGRASAPLSSVFARLASRARPNSSLNLTLHGLPARPGRRHSVHHLRPGLSGKPFRAG